jgi:hypothetical protein
MKAGPRLFTRTLGLPLGWEYAVNAATGRDGALRPRSDESALPRPRALASHSRRGGALLSASPGRNASGAAGLQQRNRGKTLTARKLTAGRRDRCCAYHER